MTTLDVAERSAILALGQGEQLPYERDSTIHALFARQTSANPHARAVIDTRGSLTYAELDARANRLANYLRACGVLPGSAVGVFAQRSLTLPVMLLGVLKAGGYYVPLDLAYPHERLALMIQDAGVRLTLGERSANGPYFADVIDVDLVRDHGEIERASDREPDITTVGSESLAYVMYTSGSTGRPKGVAVMHRGVVRLVRGTDYIAVRPSDVFIAYAPVAFDASTFELWAPLLNGATLAIPPPGLLSMSELGQLIAAFRVTVMFLTTSLFQRLVDARLHTLGTLRLLLTGGEVASPRHMQTFLATQPDCTLMAVYGPTENTTFSTWCVLPSADAIGSSVPIGRPIANSSTRVLDQNRDLVPIGVVGELWVGGDGVAQGYLHLPELTNERFIRDPFTSESSARLYRTGDRVRCRPDGVLEFLGRMDDQVKIRGHRVELGEVESTLQGHPAILDAAVVLASDTPEHTLRAWVVAASDTVLDEQTLRAYLAERLPPYMLPHRIESVQQLPQHPSGKIDRAALARRSTTPAAVAALPEKLVGTQASTTEATIGAIWYDILGGNQRPDLDENFFDAGGDSLRLLTVHERIEQEFAMSLRIVDLFEHTTIRKLAKFISKSKVQA